MAVLVCVVVPWLCAKPAWATTLALTFVDTDGRPKQVAKAELLLVAWGDADRIEFETSAHGLDLALDPEWLRSRWPYRFNGQESAYLYLQVPPLAAIRSHQFQWPGSGEHTGATTIAFSGGRRVVVDNGTDVVMTLAFRTPGRC